MPGWADGSWPSGWAVTLADHMECSAKIRIMGVWLACQTPVHEPSEPHRNSGLNHNIFWDDCGYYENRV